MPFSFCSSVRRAKEKRARYVYSTSENLKKRWKKEWRGRWKKETTTATSRHSNLSCVHTEKHTYSPKWLTTCRDALSCGGCVKIITSFPLSDSFFFQLEPMRLVKVQQVKNSFPTETFVCHFNVIVINVMHNRLKAQRWNARPDDRRTTLYVTFSLLDSEKITLMLPRSTIEMLNWYKSIRDSSGIWTDHEISKLPL